MSKKAMMSGTAFGVNRTPRVGDRLFAKKDVNGKIKKEQIYTIEAIHRLGILVEGVDAVFNEKTLKETFNFIK